MKPGLIADFRKWAAEYDIDRDAQALNLMVIDPGGTTGICYVSGPNINMVESVPLEKLPWYLRQFMPMADAVICEDYSAHGRNVDPKAVAAIGIGMVRAEADNLNVPTFLFQPNMKKAGRAHLDEAGREARTRAKNDHQRDVIDLAGKALYEIRKAQR